MGPNEMALGVSACRTTSPTVRITNPAANSATACRADTYSAIRWRARSRRAGGKARSSSPSSSSSTRSATRPREPRLHEQVAARQPAAEPPQAEPPAERPASRRNRAGPTRSTLSGARSRSSPNASRCSRSVPQPEMPRRERRDPRAARLGVGPRRLRASPDRAGRSSFPRSCRAGDGAGEGRCRAAPSCPRGRPIPRLHGRRSWAPLTPRAPSRRGTWAPTARPPVENRRHGEHDRPRSRPLPAGARPPWSSPAAA